MRINVYNLGRCTTKCIELKQLFIGNCVYAFVGWWQLVKQYTPSAASPALYPPPLCTVSPRRVSTSPVNSLSLSQPSYL